ncbi:MAG: succinate dehydrogenase, hydrophobic membrane anchor protein [Brevundimonas sp.]|uniref:succinate dehydrogenase, hydrophobic membrane anchor protein n=1 Tax=Brevundimonas sp. TaxID=1871086 RepID=UPI0025C62919|nr:succinate dehydrogenase, hydrophobic membrane anchor protein [Brevundimonas sp.]MBX3477955.1 succinate dehydrogenase, hydrophobic membrane anchor protein [Brevundimonas sp.]
MSGRVEYRRGVRVSQRHGAGEWATERVLLLALMPLGLWLAVSAFGLVGADYDQMLAWFGKGLNAALASLTALVFCAYAALAWKVIVEDYIHAPRNKTLLLVLVNLVFLALAAASIFFIVRLALGSAPLPAGIGA